MRADSIQISSNRNNGTSRGEKLLQVIRDLPRFYALALLYKKPRYGYEIMSSIHEQLGWRISPSLVYPFLKGLERDGLVTLLKEKGGRRKRVFRFTNRGKVGCKEMFQRFSKMALEILEEKVLTCKNCGCLMLGNVYSEKMEKESLFFCCRSCASSYKNQDRAIIRKQAAMCGELI